MKLLRSGGGLFRFELDGSEKELLCGLLRLYPVTPAAHHQLSQGRALPRCEEAQRMLDESLQSHREENRRQVLALLNQPGRFEKCPAGHQADFNRGEIEWLLQVINDVRIGSWLALGSPGLRQERKMRLNLDQETVGRLLTMEASAFFEMQFLSALTGEPAASPDNS